MSATSRNDDVRVCDGSPSAASAVSNGVNGIQTTPFNSKYLKAAQELLEEVVNVEKTVKNSTAEVSKAQGNNTGDSGAGADEGGGHSGGDCKRGADITTAERQDIQMKKAKLGNMLDEVEQRYRQYHHEMQIVMTWFEQIAGIASAKTYTALALQTISKQFRCLKDAILAHIRAATRALGEDDGTKTQASRLKFIDSHVRHQTTLQQLGVIQHNTWRPQRGLPEQSVSVLRSWLFEHFLHPYPKDSDKVMLAKQTGLTRGQVSNWFINARVRLWKPMVEEMYMEEMKEQEKSGSEDHSASKSTVPQRYNDDPNQNKTTFASRHQNDIESITQGSPKKARIVPSTNVNIDSKPNDHNVNNESMSMRFDSDRQGRDGFMLMGAPTNFIGGFGSYPIGDLGRLGADQFQSPYSSNGVSLTLGLQHCENVSFPGAHQGFMQNQVGRELEIGETDEFDGMNTPTNGVYGSMSLANPKRFPAQLLPDFVA